MMDRCDWSCKSNTGRISIYQQVKEHVPSSRISSITLTGLAEALLTLDNIQIRKELVNTFCTMRPGAYFFI